MKPILVWTEAYRPFAFGGDVRAPVGFWYNGDLVAYEAGKGFHVYVVKSPDKKHTLIVEKESGGIVGNDLREVENDIKQCKDRKVIEKQVAEAVERRKKVQVRSTTGFWRFYLNNKG